MVIEDQKDALKKIHSELKSIKNIKESKEILKLAYAKEYDEKRLDYLTDKFGNQFCMICTPLKDITVYTPGYGITRDGKIITVGDYINHSAVFSYYYNFYNDIEPKTLDYSKYFEKLSDIGAVLYYGVRPEEALTRFVKTSDNFLSFPVDDNLTNEQRLIVSVLLLKNTKVNPNPKSMMDKYGKHLNFNYGCIVNGKSYYGSRDNTIEGAREYNKLLSVNEKSPISLSDSDLAYALDLFEQNVCIQNERMEGISLEICKELENSIESKLTFDQFRLKDLYNKTNDNPNLNLKEKTNELLNIIKKSRELGYNDPEYLYTKETVDDVIEKLKNNRKKIQFKLDRYNGWINYIENELLKRHDCLNNKSKI